MASPYTYGQSLGRSLARHFSVDEADADGLRLVRTEDDDFVCPITTLACADPVFTEDGCIYDREHIESWLSQSASSPTTGLDLTSSTLVPVAAVKETVEAYLRHRHEVRKMLRSLCEQKRLTAEVGRLGASVVELRGVQKHNGDLIRKVHETQALCDSLRRELATARAEIKELGGTTQEPLAKRPSDTTQSISDDTPEPDVLANLQGFWMAFELDKALKHQRPESSPTAEAAAWAAPSSRVFVEGDSVHLWVEGSMLDQSGSLAVDGSKVQLRVDRGLIGTARYNSGTNILAWDNGESWQREQVRPGRLCFARRLDGVKINSTSMASRVASIFPAALLSLGWLLGFIINWVLEPLSELDDKCNSYAGLAAAAAHGKGCTGSKGIAEGTGGEGRCGSKDRAGSKGIASGREQVESKTSGVDRGRNKDDSGGDEPLASATEEELARLERLLAQDTATGGAGGGEHERALDTLRSECLKMAHKIATSTDGGDVTELEVAIARAEREGVSYHELAAAESMLAQATLVDKKETPLVNLENLSRKARQALRARKFDTRRSGELLAAMNQILKKVPTHCSKQIHSAKQLCAELRTRIDRVVTETSEIVRAAKGVDALKHAVTQAEQVGLDEDLILQARHRLSVAREMADRSAGRGGGAPRRKPT